MKERRESGDPYRSTVASMGGVFMAPLSAEHRKGAGRQVTEAKTPETRQRRIEAGAAKLLGIIPKEPSHGA